MRRIVSRIRARVLETFSGDANGTPPWVRTIAQGSDSGFFGPDSATWAVHGGMPTLVAGVRALLMQTLHPGAMAGVHDWSRYREDPLGRLAGTIQWLLTVTFADTAVAARESTRVAGYHQRVNGTYRDASGVEHPYSADDPELKLWVHAVFTDAFLSCHQMWGDSIPGGADQYVREWSIAGDLMDVPNPPKSARELRDVIDRFAVDGVLVADDRVQETLRFLRRPPLHRSVALSYRLIFAAAVASLAPSYRKMLGLKRSPFPVIWMTGILLRLMRVVLGPASSSEDAARARIAALRSPTSGS